MSEKSIATQFKSGLAHPRAIDRVARLEALLLMDLGHLTIVSDKIETGPRSRQIVMAQCDVCDETWVLLVDNIISEKTTNCRCRRGIKYTSPTAHVLGERFDAIYQRCNNPKAQQYHDYGGRGIECRFNRSAFINHMERRFPAENYNDVQIDRFDNDGHYEPGNMRVVPQKVNLRNKRSNRYYLYKGEKVVAADLHALLKRDFPNFELSPSATAKLAARGVPLDDILDKRPRHRKVRKQKGAVIKVRLLVPRRTI